MAGVGAKIERGSWQVPRIFDLIQRLGRVSPAEMDRTFNNGLGMVAVVAEAHADRVVEHLGCRNIRAYIIGEIVRGGRKVALV